LDVNTSRKTSIQNSLDSLKRCMEVVGNEGTEFVLPVSFASMETESKAGFSHLSLLNSALEEIIGSYDKSKIIRHPLFMAGIGVTRNEPPPTHWTMPYDFFNYCIRMGSEGKLV